MIDPSGKFLLVGNQKSDSISVFRLNKRTGLPVEPSKAFKSPAACLSEIYRIICLIFLLQICISV